MHISVHKFSSFNAIVCYVLQRKITHKTTPPRVVRIFFEIVAHISRRVLFWQYTARWPEAKVITKFFPIRQPLRWLPPWLWLIKNDFLFEGYGNIVPITVQRRLFCVLYVLIGISGTCFTRKSIGDKITELFTKLIANRVLWETRFEKITSDSKRWAKSFVPIIVVTVICLYYHLLLSCMVYVRHKEWSYINCFQFTFTTLSTVGFGDHFPQFKNNADNSFVLLAFAWAVRD